MDNECFNCASFASDSYTIVLDSDKVIKDTTLCEVCVSDFQDEDWIEIHGSGGAGSDGEDRTEV